MPTDEIFESAVNASGHHAGVFEYDGETSYFYLYALSEPEAKKVAGAIRVTNAPLDFTAADTAILWEKTGHKVGLFIRGNLWAVFDTQTLAKYGGNYRLDGQSQVPDHIVSEFAN